MKIKEIEYPVHGKRKFEIEYNGKNYVCYKCPFESALNYVGEVIEGMKTTKEITCTKLGLKIMLECGKL